jgi:hypothetical protein
MRSHLAELGLDKGNARSGLPVLGWRRGARRLVARRSDLHRRGLGVGAVGAATWLSDLHRCGLWRRAVCSIAGHGRRVLFFVGDRVLRPHPLSTARWARVPLRLRPDRIMSTGLIVMGDDEGERGALAKKSFGVVILDEAHKARASRGLQGRDPPKPNNLLVFLRAVARNAQNVILGSATPIQLNAVELWDLLSALNQSAPQVLGTHMDGGEWTREESIQFSPANELGRRMIRTAGACFATRCRLPQSMPCSATFATTGGWRPKRF